MRVGADITIPHVYTATGKSQASSLRHIEAFDAYLNRRGETLANFTGEKVQKMGFPLAKAGLHF
jgi:hypothetical protein